MVDVGQAAGEFARCQTGEPAKFANQVALIDEVGVGGAAGPIGTWVVEQAMDAAAEAPDRHDLDTKSPRPRFDGRFVQVEKNLSR